MYGLYMTQDSLQEPQPALNKAQNGNLRILYIIPVKRVLLAMICTLFGLVFTILP